MKVLDFNNTSHSVTLIPREMPSGSIVLRLDGQDDINCNYVVNNGYLIITFEYTFFDKDRYGFSIIEGSEIIYRGKIYVTDQETQNYKQSLDLYEF